MKKRISLLLIIAIITSLFLTSCGSGGGGAQQSQGAPEQPSESTSPSPSASGTAPVVDAAESAKDTLIVSLPQDPKDLNPYHNQGEQSRRVCFQIFERLFDPGDEPGTFKPMLAESYEYSNDGLAMTVKLRKGVKFHNGEEMKASDAVFSFKTMGAETNVRGSIDWILWDEVEAVDDYTIVIPFSYKNSLTMDYFAANNMYIMSEKAFADYGDAITQNPIGTGPFQLDKWVLDDRVELVAFQDYWGEKPKLERMILRFIAESSQAVLELETGGVDAVIGISGIDKQHVEEKPEELKIVPGRSIQNDYVFFNTSKAPFDNPLVRQACAHVISREDIFKAVYQQNGAIPYSIVPPDCFAYNAELEKTWPYDINVEKAKALMKEAGYENGLDIELYIDDNTFRISVSEIVKNQLAQIGINAKITSLDFASYYGELYKGVHDMCIVGLTWLTAEPDYGLSLRLHRNQAIDGGTNFSRYDNVEFSKLLDDARETFDVEQKRQMYLRTQEILNEEIPMISYYARNGEIATVKNLQGIKMFAGSPVFTECYFD